MFSCNGEARCFHGVHWVNHCQLKTKTCLIRPVFTATTTQIRVVTAWNPKSKNTVLKGWLFSSLMNVMAKAEDVIFLRSLSYCLHYKDSCTASCSQGLGLDETIALWLSSQCNHQRDECRGIKFQCFGGRALTHSNQSFWERILNFMLDPRVHGSLSSTPQFPCVSLFREWWLLFSLLPVSGTIINSVSVSLFPLRKNIHTQQNCSQFNF